MSERGTATCCLFPCCTFFCVLCWSLTSHIVTPQPFLNPHSVHLRKTHFFAAPSSPLHCFYFLVVPSFVFFVGHLRLPQPFLNPHSLHLPRTHFFCRPFISTPFPSLHPFCPRVHYPFHLFHPFR